MSTSLEKAQQRYETLLRQLGEKAELIGLIERTGSKELKSYQQAKESVADRNLELELLENEISQLKQRGSESEQHRQGDIRELKAEIKQIEKMIEVKKSKVGPLKSKLAGAEYDFRFVEKGMGEERRKEKELIEREDEKKALVHTENIKRLKIEILKRKKGIMDLKRQIKELDIPINKLTKEKEQLEAELDDLYKQQQHDDNQGFDQSMLQEMERQKAIKLEELEKSQHRLDVALADVGEYLYEKRVQHPVLGKYYQDLDSIATEIDRIQ